MNHSILISNYFKGVEGVGVEVYILLSIENKKKLVTRASYYYFYVKIIQPVKKAFQTPTPSTPKMRKPI